MTILFLTRRFHPLIGGVEKHVFEVSKRLVKKGHKVIVITEQIGNTSRFEVVYPRGLEDTKKTIEIYRIPAGNDNRAKKIRIWIELWKLRKVIQSADIVHCHDVFFWYLPFRILSPSKPVYTTFHGYEVFPVTNKEVVIRKISEKLSRGNICIGDFIPKWFGTKADFISYGGVNTFTLSNKKEVTKNESALFIGRLEENTGITIYIKALHILQKTLPDFELGIIGEGRLRKNLKTNARFFGSQKEPGRYFLKYHFVFVSGYLTMLEAMTAKRVICSVYDNPLKKDYLELAPFSKYTIIAQTPEELAEKILYMLRHPEKEKILIESAYEYAQKQTWEKLIDVYIKLWNNI